MDCPSVKKSEKLRDKHWMERFNFRNARTSSWWADDVKHISLLEKSVCLHFRTKFKVRPRERMHPGGEKVLLESSMTH